MIPAIFPAGVGPRGRRGDALEYRGGRPVRSASSRRSARSAGSSSRSSTSSPRRSTARSCRPCRSTSASSPWPCSPGPSTCAAAPRCRGSDRSMTRRSPTHCPYCALQCAQSLRARRMPCRRCEVAARDFPTNRGGMCQKGWTSAEVLTRDRPPDHAARAARGRRRWPLEPALGRGARPRAARLAAIQARARPRRRRGVRRGRPDQREGLHAGQVRPGRAAARRYIDYNGRFCMSSAAAAANRTLGVDRGLPFPLADLGGADAVLFVGSNPAATMPPLVQHLAGARGARRAGRRRPAALGDGRAHRRRRRHAPRAGAGHRPRRAARPDPRARRRGAGRRRVRRRAHHRLGRRARLGAPVVARARRGACDGVPADTCARAARAARGRGARARRARRLRAHRPRRRAVDPGHRRRLGRHQPGARARPARPGRLRLRPAHRAGQRPGRPRARPEERPAARLPDDRRPRGPGARRRGVGRRPRRPARPGRAGRRAARAARHAGRAAGPARARRQPGRLGPERRPRCARRSAALDLLVVGDFVPSRDRRSWPTSCCP